MHEIYSTNYIETKPLSQVSSELGHFYEDVGDIEEAALWYYNAVYQTTPVLSIATAGEEPLQGLIRCYSQMGEPEQVAFFQQEYEALIQKK